MAHVKHSEVRLLYGCCCGYCGVRDEDTGGEFTVDHFLPTSCGGDDARENLVYCCFRYNLYKADFHATELDQVNGHILLHPNRKDVDHHLQMNHDKQEIQCQLCGGRSEEVMSTLVVGLPGGRVSYCMACAAKQHADTIHTLEEVDGFIAETEQQLQILERLLQKHPKQPELPQALHSIAMTPMKVYRQSQAFLAAFKVRRMELCIATDSRSVLEYELSQAVERQDYEAASKLRDRLKELPP